MLSSFDNSTFALSLLLFGRLISCDHQAGLRFGKILSHRAFFLPQLTNLFNFLFVDEFALDISLRRRTGVELLSLAWPSFFCDIIVIAEQFSCGPPPAINLKRRYFHVSPPSDLRLRSLSRKPWKGGTPFAHLRRDNPWTTYHGNGFTCSSCNYMCSLYADTTNDILPKAASGFPVWLCVILFISFVGAWKSSTTFSASFSFSRTGRSFAPGEFVYAARTNERKINSFWTQLKNRMFTFFVFRLVSREIFFSWSEFIMH